MNDVTQTIMGRRRPLSPSDKSCTYGVVFGAEVVEVDSKCITVCVEPGDLVCLSKQCVNVYALQTDEPRVLSADDLDASVKAYENIYPDLAQKLVDTLHLLVRGKISADEYIAIMNAFARADDDGESDADMRGDAAPEIPPAAPKTTPRVKK
jgi:hypothetical protein